MKTITQPKMHWYDITCSNVACAAVMRCEGAELVYAPEVETNSQSVYTMPILSPPSRCSWAMKCPHCNTVTKTYGLLKAQARV